MNIQRLNNHDHADLRISQDVSEYEKTIYSPIVLQEFRRLQSCYPLVFTQPSDGSSYQPVALFGLQAEENLFIDAGEWRTVHIPLLIQRGPFLIGTESATQPDNLENNFIAVNGDHKALSLTEGTRIFNEDGSNTEYLNHITEVLNLIHSGIQTTAGFVEALTTHDLITPLTLRIPLSQGKAAELTGLYAIDEEKVQSLSERTLLQLHANNWLLPMYMMIASLAQVSYLADKKNQRISQSEVS